MVDYSSEYFKLLKTCSTETEKIAEMSKELAAAYEKISFYQNQLALMHERMKNGENSVDAVDQPDYNDYNDDPVDIDNFNHAFEHSILDHGKSGNFHSASVNQSQKFEKLLHKLRCTTTLTKLTTEVIDVEEEEKLTKLPTKKVKNVAPPIASRPVTVKPSASNPSGASKPLNNNGPSSSQGFKKPEGKPFDKDWEMLSDGEQECEYNQFENTILPKQRQKLTKRTTLFKNSHPGSLSHLRKAQREQLQKCISTFIHDTIPDLEDGCFAINSLSGKPEVGLPEALVDDFYEWFDDQLARGVLGGTTLPKYKPPPGHRQGQYVAPTPPPPINFAHRTPVLGGDPNLNELLEKARSEPKGNRPKPVPKAAASSPIRPKIVPRDTISSLFSHINTISDPQQAVLQLLYDSHPDQVITDPKQLVDFLNEYIESIPSNDQVLGDFERRFGAKRIGDENASVAKRAKSDELYRYTNVLKEVFIAFPQVSPDLRVKMKKAVKNWLKKELVDNFSSCVITTKSVDGKEHQSYGVPAEVLGKFKEWARLEMIKLGIEVY